MVRKLGWVSGCKALLPLHLFRCHPFGRFSVTWRLCRRGPAAPRPAGVLPVGCFPVGTLRGQHPSHAVKPGLEDSARLSSYALHNSPVSLQPRAPALPASRKPPARPVWRRTGGLCKHHSRPRSNHFTRALRAVAQRGPSQTCLQCSEAEGTAFVHPTNPLSKPKVPGLRGERARA